MLTYFIKHIYIYIYIHIQEEKSDEIKWDERKSEEGEIITNFKGTIPREIRIV